MGVPTNSRRSSSSSAEAGIPCATPSSTAQRSIVAAEKARHATHTVDSTSPWQLSLTLSVTGAPAQERAIRIRRRHSVGRSIISV